MSTEKMIQDIIDNFQEQIRLYLEVAELSQQQLDLVSKKDCLDETEQLNILLEQRQQVGITIESLNGDNQSWQHLVSQQLGIPNFILSTLQPHISVIQYEKLETVLTQLADLLSQIACLDEKSQQLLKSKSGSRMAKQHKSTQQVKNAYQEAMQQAKKLSE